MTNLHCMMHRNTRWPILIPFLVAFLYVVPSLLIKPLFIDLQRVSVHDAPTAYQTTVDVDRRTTFGAFLRYSVSFRRSSDDLQLCIISPPGFPYKGGLSNPIRGQSLGWWAGGMASPEFVACVEHEGLSDGEFYVITCHNLLMFQYLGVGRRCVRSNDFKLTGDSP